MEIYELKRSYGNLLETADLEALPYLWMQIFIYEMLARVSHFTVKLASFKEDQRSNCCNAASHVDAAVLVHLTRSGRLAAALR